jgi:hypothetical protein
MSWQTLHDDKAKVEKWLAGDKVVILSAAKERFGPCLIWNRHLGVGNKDGTWYSHPLHWPKPKPVATAYYLEGSDVFGTYSKGVDGTYRYTSATSADLLEEAAAVLGVTVDDLRGWGCDNDDTLKEILAIGDTPDTDPSDWPLLDPVEGWSARGYWDGQGRWHEPDGGIWETSATCPDEMILIGHGSDKDVDF